MSDCPLVSFCLKAYNQRDYIDAAIDGALAQTYRPIEIVICDDCSTDGTWEKIGKKLEGVESGGGRLFVVHRNERNLGNAKNWEMCGRLAQGELLVKADGDDISLPERTEKIVSAWVADGKRAKVITHAVKTLPGDSVISDRCAANPLGAGMAWTKDCFEDWPEIGEDCRRTYDDVIYSRRGLLLGSDLVMKDVLVRYRVGSGETSLAGEYRRPYARSVEGFLSAIPQEKRDLQRALERGVIDRMRYERELAGVEARKRINGGLARLLSEDSVLRKWRAFRSVRKEFNWHGQVVFAIFLLPAGISDRLMKAVLRVLGGAKRLRRLI